MQQDSFNPKNNEIQFNFKNSTLIFFNKRKLTENQTREKFEIKNRLLL